MLELGRKVPMNLNSSLSPKQIIIISVVALLVIAGIATTVIVAQTQQQSNSNAQEVATPTPTIATTSASPTLNCPPPAEVTNVKVDYPLSTGGSQVDFTRASCSWDAVTGASSYTVKVTEVESGTVVMNNQTVNPPTTNVAFAVTSGKTYKCDVTAVSSCGASGGTGTDSLLCQAQGILPTSTPVPTTTPRVTPTIPPTPVPLSCGYAPCNQGSQCQAGLVCVRGNNGIYICAQPQYQAACQATPNAQVCCNAPATPTTVVPTTVVVQPSQVPPPVVIPPSQVVVVTLPPTGSTTLPTILGIGGAAAAVIGAIVFLML